jgi:hypothetical protein
MHTAPMHVTLYSVIKSEKYNVQTIHFVDRDWCHGRDRGP